MCTSTGKASYFSKAKRRMQSAAFGPTPGNLSSSRLASLYGRAAILSAHAGSCAHIAAVTQAYGAR